MTQEKDSTIASAEKNSPDGGAAQTPKNDATPRKAPAKKTTAKKSPPPSARNVKSTGEKTAAKTEDLASAEKKKPSKPAAKKPSAKTASAKSKTPPSTKAEAAKVPADEEKKAQTTKKTLSKPSAAKTSAKKPAGKAASVKSKTAATPKAETPKNDSATARKKTASAEAPKAAAPANVPEASQPSVVPLAVETVAENAKEVSAAQIERQNAEQTAKTADKESNEAKSAEPIVPDVDKGSDETKPTEKETTVPDAAKEDGATAETDASAPEADGEEATPAEPEVKPSSSRRSRRGGRNRNKSKPAEPVDNEATTAPEQQAPLIEAEAAEEAASSKTTKPVADHKDAENEPSPRQEKNQTAAAGKTKTSAGKATSEKRKMFISVLSGELIEVVVAEENAVIEYYVEMQHQTKVKGNIYKGVVSNIDANLQAAFVSYAGGVKNGFLQIDEVHPEYYLAHHEPSKGRKFPPIQKVLKPGQEILVQVVKEPAGTKGAFLTSYLSLPGRFLVLTPGREQIGVSRKVDSDEERARLRTMLEGLTPGKGLGVIVRTVSEGAGKTSLQRDLQFLKRLWREVRAKGQAASAPSLIYEELDLAARAVRDYLTDDVSGVWVDDATTTNQITELAALLFPKKQNLVQTHHDNGHTLFERFSLQKQLDQIHSREVALPSGGRLVIDNTEALTAIDINSGRSSGKTNFEDMAFRTNLEAANAIPLQLRLRDIGGQVVVDFIEMRDRDHWREVEKAVRNGMKGDRARYDVGKISSFGLLEIVRQRLGSSAISVSMEPCPCCKGTGTRRNMEWQAMQALREINKQLRQASANKHASTTYQTEPELAFYLLNAKRVILHNMEQEAGVSLVIRPATE